VPESEIVATLIERPTVLAAEMPAGSVGSPEVVTV
jgi:(E)-4-hydroxy-3-methylbut-2-enyl-diphosphate synthase